MKDGERDVVWVELQKAAAMLDNELSARLDERVGMSSTEFQLLWYLANAVDRSLTMSEAAARLSMSPSGMTRLADRLVRRGWVERMTDAANRRFAIITLTAEGVTAARDGYRVARTARKQLFDARLTEDETRALGGIVGKLLGRIDLTDVTP
ncbi:MarR family winged helix-turn-helix transcriptional regulator [Paramicrobacterium agarici]|uniref:DNA-binding MarR family transcriptional regulator n=1 Tax=Paramicrobacterium agarici TaxID=630514 RepID=A0A2A9DVC3_9MICO|nr:MarR family transcriptional regulator [Microbacterium agarici]PFG29859.1 DNA-binding MarR family transcriptional regulator [Microbacterium agarici]TQO22868.1 DNA-binding MarR family transcriptional regulator [Microbacterium agarici]